MSDTLHLCSPTHPARPTAWRWERARWFCDHLQANLEPARDDDWVRRATELRYALVQADTDAQRSSFLTDAGALGVAFHYWGEPLRPGDGPATTQPAGATRFARAELEARLLTGVPFAETATALGTSAAVVEAYERIFFHVSDRLEVPGYILHQAIGAGLFEGTGSVEVFWKVIGWCSRNPRLLERFLCACPRVAPGSQAPDDPCAFAIQATHWQCTVKGLMSLMQTPVTKKNWSRWQQALSKLQLRDREDSPGNGDASFEENVKAMFAVFMSMVGGRASEFVGKSGEPRAAELLRDGLGIEKLSDIKNDFQWPLPGQSPAE